MINNVLPNETTAIDGAFDQVIWRDWPKMVTTAVT